jgi:predicted glycosyltransferase
VTFGGGADAAENLQLISQSLADVSKRFSTLSVMIGGPFNPAGSQFNKMPIPAGMKLIRNTNNMLSYMLTADLIVSMAGYNTIVEIIYSKAKALIIPRNGPSMEQQMRARCLEKLGLLDSISYKNLTHIELSEKIGLLLNDYTLKSDYTINLNGAFNAANILREM